MRLTLKLNFRKIHFRLFRSLLGRHFEYFGFIKNITFHSFLSDQNSYRVSGKSIDEKPRYSFSAIFIFNQRQFWNGLKCWPRVCAKHFLCFMLFEQVITRGVLPFEKNQVGLRCPPPPKWPFLKNLEGQKVAAFGLGISPKFQNFTPSKWKVRGSGRYFWITLYTRVNVVKVARLFLNLNKCLVLSTFCVSL